jgi:hypothetical protein
VLWLIEDFIERYLEDRLELREETKAELDRAWEEIERDLTMRGRRLHALRALSSRNPAAVRVVAATSPPQ